MAGEGGGMKVSINVYERALQHIATHCNILQHTLHLGVGECGGRRGWDANEYRRV